MRRLLNALRFVAAAWVVPVACTLIAFFGFLTNYATDIFSVPGVAERFGYSVFRYRVLGRELLVAVAGWLEPFVQGWPLPRAVHVMDPAADAGTYWAYVLVHAVFTGAGCSFLLVTLRRGMARDEGAAELVVAGVAAAVALTFYVVTPYDPVFFALQMAAVWMTLALRPSWAAAPLAVVTVAATLTRETAYFLPAFYAAVHHRALVARDRATLVAAALCALAFGATYAGLRAVLGWRGGALYYAPQFQENADWTSLTGSATLLALMFLLLSGAPERTATRVFAVLAVPYIVFTHVFAEPWELRLWVPVLVPLLVLRLAPARATGGRP